jgi:hypothetical protein
MYSSPFLVAIHLSPIPDTHDCSSFVPRNNSPILDLSPLPRAAPCLPGSLLLRGTPQGRSAAQGGWGGVFVPHSFFFAERNLSPQGIPHRPPSIVHGPPHLSTYPPVYLSTCLPVHLSTCVPVYFSSNWTRAFLSGIITCLCSPDLFIFREIREPVN